MLGEWGIGTGATIAKGAVTIRGDQRALCFDYGDARDHGPFAEAAGRAGVVVKNNHAVDGVVVTIDHYASEVPAPDNYRCQRIYDQLRTRFGYLTFRTGIDVLVNGAPVDRIGSTGSPRAL